MKRGGVTFSSRSRRRRKRRATAVVAVLALAAGTFAFFQLRSETVHTPDPERVAGLAPCEVPEEVLARVYQGFYPGRSGDVVAVEWLPNQFGGTRHSTPWPYTQEVPLLLYGPGFIESGRYETKASVADLAPTFAELLGFDGLGDRDGKVLDEALKPPGQRNGTPKLIFTLIWDGGGDNVLQQWPESWPNLRSLIGESAFFENAEVGSSPSITPSVHASIGSGDFPRKTGMVDIRYRQGEKYVIAYNGGFPGDMESTTLADEYDLALGNEPKIGFVARDVYHLGMVGHGAQIEGADNDIALTTVVDSNRFKTNPKFYSMPPYMETLAGLDKEIEKVDLEDGHRDLMWRDTNLDRTDPFLEYTPAWPPYQMKRMLEMLDKEGFGTDEIPDLFYGNIKTIDLAGHGWNMVEPQVKDAIEAVDTEMPRLLKTLERLAGPDGYVLAVTADHGHTPYVKLTGGWSINGSELVKDIEAAFSKDGSKGEIIEMNRGYYLYLDEKLMAERGFEASDVSRFLREYTIGDNIPEDGEVPDAFRGREEERIFITSVTEPELDDAYRCATGRTS